MKNTIDIHLDYADAEVTVNISNCFLSNKEITKLVSLLWELSWSIEGDFEATNSKSSYYFIFGLPYSPEVPLKSVAQIIQVNIQQLFPDKFVYIYSEL